MADPTVHPLCGLPGSGKTTLAKRLEVTLPAIRLTEDEWVARLFPPEAAHDDAIRVPVKDVQWDLAVRAIRLGVDEFREFSRAFQPPMPEELN